MFLSRLVKNARRSHFYLICYIYYIIWHIIETCFYILLATSNKIVFFYTNRIIESFFCFSSCYLSVFFALRKYPAVSHENLDIRKNFMSCLPCSCLMSSILFCYWETYFPLFSLFPIKNTLKAHVLETTKSHLGFICSRRFFLK